MNHPSSKESPASPAFGSEAALTPESMVARGAQSYPKWGWKQISCCDLPPSDYSDVTSSSFAMNGLNADMSNLDITLPDLEELEDSVATPRTPQSLSTQIMPQNHVLQQRPNVSQENCHPTSAIYKENHLYREPGLDNFILPMRIRAPLVPYTLEHISGSALQQQATADPARANVVEQQVLPPFAFPSRNDAAQEIRETRHLPDTLCVPEMTELHDFTDARTRRPMLKPKPMHPYTPSDCNYEVKPMDI
jgi:hypothetical protein